MQYELCRHIKTNGLRCQGAALTGAIWCYFHHRLHQRHHAFRPTEATRGYLIPGQHLELTALEDRESVQVSLSVVINALATGQLDIKRATALLYGLQLASHNARGLQTEPYAANTVRAIEPSPEGLDLAEPGAICEIEDTPLAWEAFEEDNEDEEEDEEEEEEDEGDTEEQINRARASLSEEPSPRQPPQHNTSAPSRVLESCRPGEFPGERLRPATTMTQVMPPSITNIV